jgi:hypothetical protein
MRAKSPGTSVAQNEIMEAGKSPSSGGGKEMRLDFCHILYTAIAGI